MILVSRCRALSLVTAPETIFLRVPVTLEVPLEVNFFIQKILKTDGLVKIEQNNISDLHAFGSKLRNKHRWGISSKH